MTHLYYSCPKRNQNDEVLDLNDFGREQVQCDQCKKTYDTMRRVWT